MSYSKCHSDTNNTAVCMEYTGQDIVVGVDTSRAGVTPWRDKSACLDGQFLSLQTLAEGIQGGIPSLQFSDSIQSGNRHMGNRAFLRWVGELHGDRQDVHIRGLPAQGLQHPALPRTRPAPLQLMPKKHKKKVPAAEEPQKALPEAPPQASEEPVPVLVAAVPEEKKKKKSRVQVALNTLRAGKEVGEGVEAFRRYIEVEIGETVLLHTLVERITRADDLEDRQAAALRTVEERMRRLDPEHAVPVGSQATARVQGQAAEMAVVAPAKTALSYRERDLFDCCFRGDVRKFKQLFKFKTVDVNLATEHGTLLYIAAVKGYTAIARELLSKPGIDVNLAQKIGVTPLCAAAELGHVELVRLLLAAPGINPNLGTFRVGTTPLTAAAYKGHLEVVELLLTARNSNINVRQHNGATALCIAAQDNFPGIVELLVRSGANVNLALDDGTSPLCAAAFMGGTEVVKRLFQAQDIQVDRTTCKQVTALAYASQQGHKDIVEFLLDKKADPNIADDEGVAPLHFTCIHGYADIARMLLNAEADMELRAGGKYTPYHIAQLLGHQALADLLKAHRRNKVGQAAKFGKLSPCLRPQGQALEDQPGRPSPAKVPSASLLQADIVPAVQPDEAVATPPVTLESGAAVGMELAGMAQVVEGPVDISEAVPGTGSQSMEPQSPLARARKEFIQEILRKLREDWLDPLDGIRLLEAVNTVTDLDGLCVIFNRLAGIERKKFRGGRRQLWRGVPAAEAAPADAGPCGFALGERQGLDAEAVEDEIKQHLAQPYHRFVSQAVNDMEFGRGKPTTGYPGLLHASAGIAGVGSCRVFFYADANTRVIRIAGIGHHLDRGTYRLDYAAAELRGLRTIRLS